MPSARPSTCISTSSRSARPSGSRTASAAGDSRVTRCGWSVHRRARRRGRDGPHHGARSRGDGAAETSSSLVADRDRLPPQAVAAACLRPRARCVEVDARRPDGARARAGRRHGARQCLPSRLQPAGDGRGAGHRCALRRSRRAVPRDPRAAAPPWRVHARRTAGALRHGVGSRHRQRDGAGRRRRGSIASTTSTSRWARRPTPSRRATALLDTSYSIHTVLDEASQPAALFTGGALRFVPPLSGAEAVDFPRPVGRRYPACTLHSELATLPASFRAQGRA